MSRFFIERPIFAVVVSIVIVVAGLVSLVTLPIAEYPDLAPPTIEVSAVYPGADAETIADTVSVAIEREVNGVEGMLYMSSTCSGDGTYKLTVTFATGTDLDIASVQVQNRVAAAEPKLPEDVRRQGVKTQKKMPDFAQMVSVTSPDGRYDDVSLSNYATLQISEQIKRIPGVGGVQVFGAANYAMRVWLDPDELAERGLTSAEVLGAIREQNVQVAAGKIGAMPDAGDAPFEYAVSARGRLATAEEFGALVVRTGADGRVLRLRDVARIELDAQNYAMESRVDGKPAAVLAIFQQPGANLIEISDALRVMIEEAGPSLPDGLELAVTYDAADAVRASLNEIVVTLFIAAALVILTVLFFLQDFRATIIPAVTIPVSLVGTFAVMAGLGFTLNTLTLFGLVLAIGIVVDDAIVVVENVARNLEEPGVTPREATIRAMREVSGPVVATTLVLLAVFVPASFLGGITGVMYRQFGLTISAATIISSINALTLSPALYGVLMRPSGGKKNPLFRAIDALIVGATRGYTSVVTLAVRRAAFAMLLFLAVSAAGVLGFVRLPTGFAPQEDKGLLMASVQLPDAASRVRTRAVTDEVDAIVAQEQGVRSFIQIGGFSLIDGVANPNVASYIITLDPWEERAGDELHQSSIGASLQAKLAGTRDGIAFVFETPPIPGVGLTGGFDMRVQDRGGLGTASLQTVADDVAGAARAQPALARVNSSFRATTPRIFVDVDRDKVKQIGLPVDEVFRTLQTNLGGSYANDFNAFGGTFQVLVQAEGRFRSSPEDILRLRVPTPSGGSVPMGSIASVEQRVGPSMISRYNLYPAASVKGEAAPGRSSGEALALMEELAGATLPGGAGYEWTGLAYQQRAASASTAAVFALALLLVFLVLAAQYESWLLPVTVLLAVPLGLLGVTAGVLLRGLDNNTYTQIGVILLIALVSKNAILIVEFARAKRMEGLAPAEAAINAAELRFRPILMTAFSFVLGTLPLLIASGAGAGARIALGTAVFFGLVVATILGVFATPMLFRIIDGLGSRARADPGRAGTEPGAARST
ncbi:MAG: multidrug efflux RND transporter permease subunit [Phycisphaerales bacterium]